ncbi:MAG: hypothetical protein ABII79_10075 [bacterium]
MNNSMITQIDVNRRKRSLTAAIILTAVLALVLGGDTIAAGRTSARGVAMGEAMTGLAAGVDAARYNPANLGLEGYRQSGIELIGLGANISNNAFTLGDYNRYTGAFLTDADKDDILESVPREGLTLVADVQASAMSLAMGSFVFSTTGVGLVDANISRDVIDLMFNGNSFADVIDLTGTHLDAVGYAALGCRMECLSIVPETGRWPWERPSATCGVWRWSGSLSWKGWWRPTRPASAATAV